MSDLMPTAIDGPVRIYTDPQGWHIAFRSWRTLCATTNLSAAQRIIREYIERNPGVQVLGEWVIH